MSKIIELISRYLLLPLLKDGAMWVARSITKWWNNRKELKRRKKLEKENQEKAEKYEASSTNDSTDEFGKLP